MKFSTQGLEGYITDRNKEAEEGVWIRFGGQVAMRILRAGGANKDFTRAFQTAIKPYERQLKKGTLDPEVSDEVMRRVYARHVVKEWHGVIDTETGKSVPFSPDACEAWLRQFPEAFNELVNIATELATFAQDEANDAKAELGNS